MEWCGVAVAALVVAAVLPVLVSGAAGFVHLRWVPGATVAALLTVPVSVVFMLATAGEELAWRGYLATLLAPFGFARSAALIGSLWAAWHLPLTVALWRAGEVDGRDVVAKTIDLLLASVFLASLRYLSGSVWPAVFAHALFNNLFQMVQYNAIEPLHAAPAAGYWGFNALSWLVWLAIDMACVALVRRRGLWRRGAAYAAT